MTAKRKWDPKWGSPIVLFRFQKEALEKLNAAATRLKLSRSALIKQILMKWLEGQ